MPKTSDRPKRRDAADNVAKALAHRMRVDILTVLQDGPASQKDLARQLRQPLSNINHHINELIEADAIEIAYTKKVGNVDQHYWRAIRTSTFYAEDLAELTWEEHQMLSRIIVQSITAELLASLRAGKLAGDPYAVTGWDRVWLDEQGFRDMYENTCAFSDRMNEIAAEAAARTAETGETPKPYIGAVMSFERSRTEPNTAVTVGDLEQEEPPGTESPFEK